MTKTSNNESIVQGNFCEIVNHFRQKEIDDVDRLVQRGLTIIFATERLFLLGTPSDDYDASTAHTYATAALGTIHAHIRNYPFLRDGLVRSSTGKANFSSAHWFIGEAERLLRLDTAVARTNGWILLTSERTETSYQNASCLDGAFVYGDGTDLT